MMHGRPVRSIVSPCSWVLIGLAACRSPAPPAEEQPPSETSVEPSAEEVTPDPPADVFGPWDGVWQGTFQVKDGEEILTELRVVQRYRSDSIEVQHGRFEERDVETGKVVTATATNRITPDGLRCEVEKSNGTTVVHQGRRLDDGGIEWFRKTPDLEEHFFERVVADEEGRRWYTVEGWGRYGAGPRLSFAGRYRQVGPEPESF